MARIIDKREIPFCELHTYIDTELNGWVKTKHDKNVNDMIYENGKDCCFIYRFGAGFLIQKIEG